MPEIYILHPSMMFENKYFLVILAGNLIYKHH